MVRTPRRRHDPRPLRRPPPFRPAPELLEGRTLPSFLPAVPLSTREEPQGVVAADFTGDGVPDLAGAERVHGSSDSVSVLAGNGDGTFGPPTEHRTDWGPSVLAAGDFDSNGFADLAVLSTRGLVIGGAVARDVQVLLNNGDGTFR